MEHLKIVAEEKIMEKLRKREKSTRFGGPLV